jgi:TP901 family phage tail tape measure protein
MADAGKITAIIDGDISALTSALNQAKSQATAAISGIEGDFKSKMGSGLSSSISGGDFTTAGKRIGTSLVDGVTGSFGPMGAAVGEIATTLGPAGIAATAAIAGAAIIGKAASSAAMEWEAGMSQISKTTGIEKGTQDFANLSSELTNLYSTMPTTMAEIQNVARSAGSLGIDKSSIAGFTEVALQMGSAFDIPAEQAAVAVGKVKSQLKSLPEGATDAADFAQKFGSAVDFAGNSMNATEAEVLDFSTRTAGAFSTLGGSAYEVAGWGGSLASVFSSSELAAGSFNAALNQLRGTTKGSDMARAKAGELLGVTPDEFKELMANDPTDTLLRLGEAMEGLGTADQFQAAGILGGGYGDDFFVKMSGHTAEWRGQIAAVVAEGEKGESIGNSFAAGADNAKSGFQTLKNSVSAILKDMGGPINDVGSAIAGGLAENLNKVRTIGEELWGPFTAAISPATEAVSTLAGGIGKLVGLHLDVLVAGAKGINTAFQTGKAFVSAFKEEITEVITKSETFQTIAGYVEKVTDAFTDLKNKAADIWDKVFGGLSDAIPKALSGAAGAIGTLLDKVGLGGITDAGEGLGGFLGKVYDNAAEKLGWGIKESTEEGMVEGTDAAQDDIQGSVEEAVGEGAKNAFENVSPELATIMKNMGVGDEAALAYLNAQTRGVQDDRNSAGVTSTTLANGLKVDLKYQTDDGQTRAVLMVNGQEVAGPVYGWGIEKTLPELFKQAKLGYNRGNVLDLTNQLGDSAIWQATQTQDIILDTYLDVASNVRSEIEATGEQISTAFTAGMVPDKAQVEASLENLRHLQLYDPDEAKAQGSQNAINYLTALKDAIESYDEAKAKYLVEPDNERALADLERSRANLQARLDANPLKAPVVTAWGQFDTKSFSELIMDPEAVKNAAVDIDKFFDGTIVPGIRGGMEAARAAFDSGQITQGAVYDNLIKPLEQYADYLPGWLEEMNAMFKSGQIGIEDYIWLLDQMTGKASDSLAKTSDAVKDQTVGWDALKDTIGDCSECAISEFAQWQESQDGLFQDSYIGQGGQAYLDWKNAQIEAIAETQAAMDAVGGAVLGKRYTAEAQKITIEADTSPAEQAKTALENSIATSRPKLMLEMDTSVADTRFMNLVSTIQNTRPSFYVDIVPMMDVGGLINYIASALRAAGL